MSAIINGDSPSITFSDGTTQATSAIVSGKVPYTNLPAGSVLQVVQGTYTTYPNTTTSTSFVATGHTVSITPKYSTSKILLINHNGALANGATSFRTIYRNSTNLGDATYGFIECSGSVWQTGAITYLDSPATTSAITYQIYHKSSNGTAVYYGADNGQISVLIAMEIAG